MADDRAQLALTRSTFGALTDPLRHDLLVHCYRFVGSVTEAEDLVQETLARAWRGRDGYRGEAGLRTWLRRIATHACLDELRRGRPRRTLPSEVAGSARGEPLWLEPLPDDLLDAGQADPAAAFELRESVSMAFMIALHRLPPRQRAVLILRDVLTLSAAEAADQLGTSVSSVNSLLHRARRTMRSDYAPTSIPRPDDPTAADLLRRYLAAWETGDIDALLATLKADATLEMPPIPDASVGHAAIRAFLAGRILDGTPGQWRGMTIGANGGPAVALYQREADAYRFVGIQLLTIDAGRVCRVTAYMDPALATTFRLPVQLTTGRARASIYRSTEAQAAIADLYRRARHALPFPTSSRMVPTRFGESHVLLAGSDDGAPIVVFGGGNVVGPLTLGWFAPMAAQFRLVAPDTIGQPGRSAGWRVSGADDSLGRWALDVLDALGLDRVGAIGVSYGAGVLLRLAEIAPERIGRAALVVPSGLSGSPVLAMLRLAASYAAFRIRPSRARAASVTEYLAHGPADDLMIESVELSFAGTKLETEMPRIARGADLAGFRSPTIVIAAEHDPLFPPARILPAARAIIPNLASAAVLRNAGHIPSPEAAGRLSARLTEFFSPGADT